MSGLDKVWATASILLQRVGKVFRAIGELGDSLSKLGRELEATATGARSPKESVRAHRRAQSPRETVPFSNVDTRKAERALRRRGVL